MFAIFGVIFVIVELGVLAVPFGVLELTFVYFVLTAAHTYRRSGPLSGTDALVAAYTGMAAILVLTQLEILTIEFGASWAAFVIVILVVAHGYVVEE